MAKLTGNSRININANLSSEVFGGGNIAVTSGTTRIDILGGTHTGNIYGGGNLGVVQGNTTVNIQGGTNNIVLAGGNQAEVTNTALNISGGSTNIAYGGGNNANIQNSTVTVTNGVTNYIYGGGNEGETVSSNLTISGGDHGYIYGGGNKASTTTTTINVNGGTTDFVYGGGNEGEVATSNVNVSNGQIGKCYGGGNKAETENTNVTTTGGNITDLFGGGNEGTVETTKVIINNGTITNAFGGGNKAEVETANLTINGGTLTSAFGGGNEAKVSEAIVKTYGGNTQNLYGGANNADAPLATITLYGGTIGSVFGGSNQQGTATSPHIITSPTSTLAITNLYGGNNQGGLTKDPDISISGGNITNIYGGGNQATTNATNVVINSGNINRVFGGGNAAAVTSNTNLLIKGGQIGQNVYGGGNDGTVGTNTYVKISGATILGSCYAGGNGVTAVVYGNTNIDIEGSTIIGSETSVAPQAGSVFGGGNAAATGVEGTDLSTATVNIAGGTIYGNVYGGANTSVVYGEVFVNLGKDAVTNNALTLGDIYVKGTIFGGGEANAAGDENYDFDFISVTRGITININGNGHSSFKTNGSIFGSGNASSASGDSVITIKNYGTFAKPQNNISIQRANYVTIDNSSITLSGATDRCNDYSNVKFTLSRIDELKLKNSSCIYLNCGANLLKKVYSLVDIAGEEELATVDITESGVTKNVDNRIYLLENKNLNIATNQSATLFGDVYGMTFLGLYSNANNPNGSTGFYNYTMEDGDTITNFGTFSYNSYVKGAHKANHNIEEDGFYTNINNDGIVKTQYVGVTPEDDTYYIWLVGEALDITTYEIEMIGSKYATLGTYELSLTGFSEQNSKFILSGLSLGLNDNINLVDKNEINSIEPDETIANSNFGLSVQTGKSGWQTNSKTNFYSENGGTINGTTMYVRDNTLTTPSLLLCFYHAQNLSVAQDIGTVTIRYQVLIPIDDLNDDVEYIDIVMNLSTALYQDNYYEEAISPGEEFDLFRTTETNITSSSAFSTYYSLLITNFSENEDYYDDFNTYHRALVSIDDNNEKFVFPENTTITMIDLYNNKYYYYNVTASDETNQKNVYNFSDFIEMGSTDKHYSDIEANALYYDTSNDLVYESFIVHVDFKQADITEDSYDNSLLIELRDSSNDTLIGVLGIERDSSKYSLYANREAVIEIEENISPSTLYLGKTFDLDITTRYTQSTLGSKLIYDTRNFDNKMGIKISVYDSNNNKLSLDSLLGIVFKLDGTNYYPRVDGNTRIKISDRVTDILSKIDVDTSQNTTLATDTYKIRVETFSSADGIYYSSNSNASAVAEKQIRIINETYGLKVTTPNVSKIFDKETGQDNQNNKSLVSTITYSSGYSNPKITVALYRRNYDSIYSRSYDLVDLAEYVSTVLEDSSIENEYMVTTAPLSEMTYSLYMKANNKTGTYKLVYKLYDGDTFIGEAYEYFVIK